VQLGCKGSNPDFGKILKKELKAEAIGKNLAFPTTKKKEKNGRHLSGARAW